MTMRLMIAASSGSSGATPSLQEGVTLYLAGSPGVPMTSYALSNRLFVVTAVNATLKAGQTTLMLNRIAPDLAFLGQSSGDTQNGMQAMPTVPGTYRSIFEGQWPDGTGFRKDWDFIVP